MCSLIDDAGTGVALGTTEGTLNVGIGDADIAVSEGLSSDQGGSNLSGEI